MKTLELIALLEYNYWANERIFQRAARLSVEQLTATSWLSHHSLMKTLIHIVDAEWSWRSCCQEGVLPLEYLNETQFRDIPALRNYSKT